MFWFTILFCLYESEKILTGSQSLSKKKKKVLVPNVILCLLLKQEKVAEATIRCLTFLSGSEE